ncbi:MAG: P1 family peptidase [Gemmatimonadetes bacterium]|nr:P1 family peptidase [Gemmatimonadota bacterium]
MAHSGTDTALDSIACTAGGRISADHPAYALACLGLIFTAVSASAQERPRARDIGVAPGVFAPGVNNAITDVAGVRVGHATVDQGDRVRTGVTAIIPHPGNAYLSRVPAAVHVGNAFGKLVGSTQIVELGELETPILLTCTLCVWKAADALTEWMLGQPGMERVRSINPVVGETNDGGLNDIRSRPISAEDVRRALDGARDGPVEEGSVGAGRGTVAFGWKGGIGTSSRKLPAARGAHTVGVLVQSNYGGVLQMGGAPVGRELGQYAYKNETSPERGDGSVMIVVATDAPLSDRNLQRLAARAMLGIGRTGASGSNGSGDYVIAFSTATEVRRAWDARRHTTTELSNDQASALFEAAIEATEEAAYNSILRATAVTGNGRTVEAIDIEKVKEVLAKYRPQ